MPDKLRILFVSAEMSPYAKTGGLADVTASLAAQLHRHGHDVHVVLPLYRSVRSHLSGDETRTTLCVTMGTCEEWCAVVHGRTEQGLPVDFIEHDRFFDRPGLYHDDGMTDYADNPWRFAFFCRAALQTCMDTGFEPDIVHANDWQTALVPAYLKVWFWSHPVLGRAASVLTLHNVAYQGVYPAEVYPYTGLGDANFTADRFESFGRTHFLKGGIHFADAVNTVSPGHAREITSPYGGFGLAPYLSDKGEAFRGILNGVDYSVWSPESDRLIPADYSLEDMSGKAVCKRALQKAFQVEEREDMPIIASVGRFTFQKGYHLLKGAIEDVLSEMSAQFVILGTGEWDLASYFGALPSHYAGQAGSFIGYNDALAHLIEAGADFFVMPSIFEPCGLNQIYSMRYGALPIVRATGGLDDTVEQYDERGGTGTGFKFHAPTGHAVYNTIGWAVSTWFDRPGHIRMMRRNAMSRDFSWDRSACAYEDFYELARRKKSEYDARHTV